MRYRTLSHLLILLSLGISQGASAQVTSSQMTSSTQIAPRIEAIKPLQKSTATGQPPREEIILPPMAQPPTLIPQQSNYFHPGILVRRNGTWEGSDQLLNLSPNIGVYVTILKPEDLTLPISSEQLRQQVEMVFGQVGIKPVTLAAPDRPPLPAFEVEILIYPIERGYVACCGGHLFESVTLGRFILEPNMAFQAITWEKQSLIVGPKSKFIDQLIGSVQEIAHAFADRFQTYERMRSASPY